MRSVVKAVKAIGQGIGDAVARVILTLFYFLFLTPVAVWQRWRKKSSTQLADGAETFWTPRQPDHPTLDDARRAY